MRSVLPPSLVAQLMAVEPSRDGQIEYRPCRVTVEDDSVHDHVYVQRADVWFDYWGVDPEDDAVKRLVPIETVVGIEESPTRLPARFADRMYAAGESAMGGCFFAVVLRDGRRIHCETGNAVDFLDWPPDVEPGRIVDLLPHEGRMAKDRIRAADYAWSLYEPD